VSVIAVLALRFFDKYLVLGLCSGTEDRGELEFYNYMSLHMPDWKRRKVKLERRD